MAMAETYSDGTPVEPAAELKLTAGTGTNPVTGEVTLTAGTAPKLTDDEIKAQAEHDFLARYTERKATAYADELADLAGQLRYMAGELQRQGLQLAYPNEPAPNFVRAATAAVTVAVDNSRVRLASLLNRAAEAQAALSDLAAWEAQH